MGAIALALTAASAAALGGLAVSAVAGKRTRGTRGAFLAGLLCGFVAGAALGASRRVRSAMTFAARRFGGRLWAGTRTETALLGARNLAIAVAQVRLGVTPVRWLPRPRL